MLLQATGCSKSPSEVLPTNLYAPADYPNTIIGLNNVLQRTSSGRCGMRTCLDSTICPLAPCCQWCTHVANDGEFDTGWTEMCLTNFSNSNSYALGVWASVDMRASKITTTALQEQPICIWRNMRSWRWGRDDLIRGQAYCLRGYYYLLLESLCLARTICTGGGTMGVPIDDTRSLLPVLPARRWRWPLRKEDVWALVESDLVRPALLLPTFWARYWTGNDPLAKSEWAAKGLLGIRRMSRQQDWHG